MEFIVDAEQGGLRPLPGVQGLADKARRRREVLRGVVLDPVVDPFRDSRATSPDIIRFGTKLAACRMCWMPMDT